MAGFNSKTLLVVLSLLLLIALSHVAEAKGKGINCNKSCKKRCSKTHHLKPCLFYCRYCCARCKCVPSGTYGNKATCPCYNNMKTKEGRPKCP